MQYELPRLRVLVPVRPAQECRPTTIDFIFLVLFRKPIRGRPAERSSNELGQQSTVISF